MKNQPGNMKNQPGIMKNHENRPGTVNNQPGTMNTHENRPGTINKQKRYKQTDTQNLPIIYRCPPKSLISYHLWNVKKRNKWFLFHRAGLHWEATKYDW